MEENKRTQYFNMSNGIINALVSKKLVYRSSNISSIIKIKL